MSVYYWPPSLPQSPLRSSYCRGVGNNIITSDMEYGPPKTRRRGSAALEPMSVSYVLDSKQLKTLKDFYTMLEGLSFRLPDPENAHNYLLVKIVPTDNDRVFEYLPYGAQHWRVDMQMRVWPYADEPR